MDGWNKGRGKGWGKAYKAVIAGGRLWKAYLGADRNVGFTARPAGASGGLKRELLSVSASIGMVICVA